MTNLMSSTFVTLLFLYDFKKKKFSFQTKSVDVFILWRSYDLMCVLYKKIHLQITELTWELIEWIKLLSMKRSSTNKNYIEKLFSIKNSKWNVNLPAN